MELKQLVYFESVGRLLSFTQASKELHVTQPTITIAVNNLESEFGLKLFIRNKNNVQLSPEGEIFYAETKTILAAVQNCQIQMAGLSKTTKRALKIGAPTNLGSWLYKVAMKDFSATVPNVRVEMRDWGVIENLTRIKNDDIELALSVIDDSLDSSFESLVLKRGYMSVLLSNEHPLAQYPTIALEQLANEQIIMYKQGTTWIEKEIQKRFAACRLPLTYSIVVEQHLTLYNLVSKNAGISFTLDENTDAIKNYSNIISRGFTEPIPYQAGIVWDKNRFLSTSAKKFLNFIANYADD